MVAGILLGPSALGRMESFTRLLFPAASVTIVRVCSSFGLVVFMFLVGMEMDVTEFQHHFKQVLTISGIGVIGPCLLVAPVALLFDDPEFSNTSTFNLMLFLGVAMGMSALPVLARILAERNMLSSSIGNLIMGATAIDDVMAWILLSIVVAIVRSSGHLNILYVILLSLGNVFFVYYVIRPLLAWFCRHVKSSSDVKPQLFFIIFATLLSISWFTESIGLSALVGAFEVGLMMPRNPVLLTTLSQKLEDITVVIIMPLFFTNSGLRTNFFLLSDGRLWGLAILLIVVATVTKIISIFIPAKLFGLSTRDSLAFGILMSCKGLVGLIVINFGLDYGVITPTLFALLVVMVLITSLLTVPLTELVLPLKLFKEVKKQNIHIQPLRSLEKEQEKDQEQEHKQEANINTQLTGQEAPKSIHRLNMNIPLPISSSSSYDDLFKSHTASTSSPHHSLVIAITNCESSPSLVSLVANLQHGWKSSMKANPHEMAPHTIIYRPLLNDDVPSGYMRPSLQSLLIRDDAMKRVMDRIHLYDMHDVGLVAMPVSRDDMIGQLSMLLVTCDAEYVLMNHSILYDMEIAQEKMGGPHAPVQRLITACQHAKTTLLTWIDNAETSAIGGAGAISSSPMSPLPLARTGMDPNTPSYIIIPLLPGSHTTQAIQLARSLQHGNPSIHVVLLELTPQHGQEIPSNPNVIVKSIHTDPSRERAPSEHILVVHPESSTPSSSFLGYSHPSIRDSLLSSIADMQAMGTFLSLIILGDYDTMEEPIIHTQQPPQHMATWLQQITQFAPVAVVRAPPPTAPVTTEAGNTSTSHEHPIAPTPRMSSLTVAALQFENQL